VPYVSNIWCVGCSVLWYRFLRALRRGLVTVLRTTFLGCANYQQNRVIRSETQDKNTQIMEDKHEELLNYLYAQITANYYLKTVCLEILKDLDQKQILNEKERYWQHELLNVLLEPADI